MWATMVASGLGPVVDHQEAGLGLSLVIAFVAAFPLNRWLIARDRGHAVVHELHAY